MNNILPNFDKYCLSKNQTIREAAALLDSGASQFLMIVCTENTLLGTITDGDIRRGLLKNITLEDPVSKVMNRNPVTVSKSENVTFNDALKKMRYHKIRHIPVIDGYRKVEKVFVDRAESDKRDNLVVLMAGGLGSRLGELTKDCPKPMLQVGDKPILETVITRFKEQGFYNFAIAVNYKSDMIVDYFGDGSALDINITYITEKMRMGTAGALSLIPKHMMQKPFIVMNADLITKTQFGALIDFHESEGGLATMCVRDYHIQIPFGVVEVDKYKLQGITEKPEQRFFVNAGMYVLNPECCAHIPEDAYYDMPSLFQAMIDQGLQTNAFPIREYWIDIGRITELDKARKEYKKHFPASERRFADLKPANVHALTIDKKGKIREAG
jgi:dTDP-glucose pyrophosphorylase